MPAAKPSKRIIGRDVDVDAIRELLRAGSRLVTVTGPAGVGKKSVVAAVAREIVDRPTFTCPLRGTSPEDVGACVAQALGLGAIDPGRTARLGRAAAKLGAFTLVIEGPASGAAIADIVRSVLDAAREAQILVSSREPLELADEQRYALAPLATADAVALFEIRALAVAAHARAALIPRVVHELVGRLDRLPLAIELAAARVESLTPSEILARLDGELLGVTDVLGTAIESSWRQLDVDARTALVACALFESPFPVDAAESVIGRSALSSIESLSRKSILGRASDAAESERPLLALLSSVRTFAAAKLDGLAARNELELRHAEWFVREGERHAANAFGEAAGGALDALTRMQPDLLAAHRRMVPAQPSLAGRAALVLDRLWSLRGPAARREALLTAAIGAATSDDVRLEVECRIARAETLQDIGASDAAEGDLVAARARAHSAGLSALEAEAVRQMVGIDVTRGNFSVALARAGEAVALHGGGRDARLFGLALSTHGRALAWTRRGEEARTTFLRALAVHRQARDRHSEGLTLVRLANLSVGRVYDPRTRELLEHASRIHRDAGDLRREVLATFILGLAHHHEGSLEQARGAFERARSLARDLGEEAQEARACSYLAATAFELGERDLGRALASEALLRHETNGETRYAAFTRWLLGHFALEERAFAEARAHLEAAVSLVQGGEDDSLAVLYVAAAAGLDAMTDRVSESARRFAEAAARESTTSEPYLRAFVSVLQGLHDVALARATPSQAATHLADAMRRIDDVSRADACATAFSSDVRLAARLVAAELARAARSVGSDTDNVSLVVAHDGRWFTVGDQPRVDLARRRALHRIVRCLAEAHVASPGTALSCEALRDAGWPDEQMLWSAARNRVYAGIRTLRELGLDAVLATQGDGYLFAPRVRILIEDSDGFR